MYWKKSKNFAALGTAQIQNALAVADNELTEGGYTGSVSMHLPSGPFTFIMRNATLLGVGGGFGLGGGQHCGIIGYNYGFYGAHCTTEFILEDVDVSQDTNKKNFQFGVSGGSIFHPTFTTYDSSFKTSKYPGRMRDAQYEGPFTLASGYMTGLLDREGCFPTEGTGSGGEHAPFMYDGGIMCDSRTTLRRLNLWTSTMQGDAFISGPGFLGLNHQNVTWDSPIYGFAGGVLKYDTTGSG
jgi:hypothetical protein